MVLLAAIKLREGRHGVERSPGTVTAWTRGAHTVLLLVSQESCTGRLGGVNASVEIAFVSHGVRTSILAFWTLGRAYYHMPHT